MTLKYNPFTGQLDEEGAGGGGLASGEVLVDSFDLVTPSNFIDLRNVIDDSSKLWRLLVIGLQADVDGRTMRLQGYFSDVLNVAADHNYTVISKKSSGVSSEEGSNTSTFINTTLGGTNALGNAADEYGYMDCTIYEPGAAKDTQLQGRCHFNSNSGVDLVSTRFGGGIRNGLAMDGIRLYLSVGDITAGKVYLTKNTLFT